ncbi:MAG: hypothetical protein GY710_11875 [Desulfobacteraceae bacterium]|nr:hypothetical protein [Desulfobacteraceae bacterium]
MFKIPGTALILIILLLTAYGNAAGVKTYYKQYSIFTYENENILCEPYQVKKDDWLYKIFRQKGEISETDFPRFLKIFTEINPKINNIDAITPGLTILIPLKPVETQMSDRQTLRIVKVPVIEFSSVPETFNIHPFIRQHTIRAGDTVSKLLDTQFLKKNGAISQEAKTTFTHLNPGIKDINMIYQGTQVALPDPSILSQPWFKSFLKYGRTGPKPILHTPGKMPPDSKLPVISPRQMMRLKRYAALIQGSLINQGQMYFPGKARRPGFILDLTKTPLIKDKNGQRILIIPSNGRSSSLANNLIKNIKAYWKHIKVQEINKAISMADELKKNKNSLSDKAIAPAELISKLLSVTQYQYTPDEKISFSIGPVEMNTSLGRISQENQPDLFINPGRVYGLALKTIEKQGHQLLSFSPGLTMSELILTLFTNLGYSTWENPSFTTSGSVKNIQGIYVAKDKEKIFFTRQKPDTIAMQFLESEGIQFLILNQ